ncbi:FAD-binding oxidoreductase [Calothrix sp. FACHB-1219]|uniref:NAD(P)/FAD-dependent oxidoreductase n=1 Tax=unclassified Calothrix TaxID=2619626 RepID=UPI0016826F2E|nr:MULTISPECIES: FAD-binding oxidoreductase [unclassified Calothrix]MBD2208160.1 FAD-binding oxidoreductase [Calothrix sp. FACHB-168]MBD2222671.1 FAD-binding oxidoreductase [Calothrix sp. FACHB-1219]
MKTYDWIVVGGGITGAAVAYELAKTGFSVLLLEQNQVPDNATRYSYGGLAYWSGNTPITRQLCADAIARYQILPQELDADIEFRELDLLLTIPTDEDPELAAESYANCAIPPRLLTVTEAGELEPLLNRDGIPGALTVKHGHIQPEKTLQAYIQAFLRIGGEMQISQVLQVLSSGVKTATETFTSANVVICAGGLSRQLLKAAGIPIKLYFTHAEIIETPPVDLRLNTLVMPATIQRFQLEAQSTQIDLLWDEPGNEPAPPILDAGAIQFLDGSLRLGQISRTLTDPHAKINAQASEQWLRSSISQILPALANLPGTWYHSLVAFTPNRLPIIGAIPGFAGVHIFSGFSNPLVLIPPLAQRFAKFVSGQEDEIISQLLSTRPD